MDTKKSEPTDSEKKSELTNGELEGVQGGMMIPVGTRLGLNNVNPKVGPTLTKAAEAAELTRLLETIDDIVQESPELLGQPGQPGYRVLSLARQEPAAERFKALDPDQRETLAA
jgi:hypothetical protein